MFTVDERVSIDTQTCTDSNLLADDGGSKFLLNVAKLPPDCTVYISEHHNPYFFLYLFLCALSLFILYPCLVIPFAFVSTRFFVCSFIPFPRFPFRCLLFVSCIVRILYFVIRFVFPSICFVMSSFPLLLPPLHGHARTRMRTAVWTCNSTRDGTRTESTRIATAVLLRTSVRGHFDSRQGYRMSRGFRRFTQSLQANRSSSGIRSLPLLPNPFQFMIPNQSPCSL
jgi:hypothetical protein